VQYHSLFPPLISADPALADRRLSRSRLHAEEHFVLFCLICLI